jgi:hypothetical protein
MTFTPSAEDIVDCGSAGITFNESSLPVFDLRLEFGDDDKCVLCLTNIIDSSLLLFDLMLESNALFDAPFSTS